MQKESAVNKMSSQVQKDQTILKKKDYLNFQRQPPFYVYIYKADIFSGHSS